jgi:two-component sensor histidine kinase
MAIRPLLFLVATILLTAASASAQADTAQMDVLLRQAFYQIAKPGEAQDDLDSAETLILQAEQINKRLMLDKYDGFIDLMEAHLFDERGQKEKGKAANLKAIDILKKTRKCDSLLAEACYELRVFYPSDSALTAQKNAILQAAFWWHLTGDYQKEGDKYAEIGHAYHVVDQRDSEEVYYRRAEIIFRSIHSKTIAFVLPRLAESAYKKNDMVSYIAYLMEGYKYLNPVSSELRDGYYYGFAKGYNTLGLFDESLSWATKGMELTRLRGSTETFDRFVRLSVLDLLGQHKIPEVLRFIQKLSRDNPPDPNNIFEENTIEIGLGRSFAILKQYDKAEPYYASLEKRYNTRDIKKDIREIKSFNTCLNFLFYNQVMAAFSNDLGKYDKAEAYLQAVHSGLKKYGGPMPLPFGLNLLEFQVDSARKNYLSAIRHFELAQILNDSLLDIKKMKHVSELNIQYKTYETEKDLLVLQGQKNARNAELQRVNLQKELVLGATSLLLVMAGLTFRSYRLKQKTNRALRLKQTEIDQQHLALGHLVSAKDHLLEEKEALLEVKEILMQEIHHRVKNNLHMVSSLLESQTAYLEDEALAAVQKSQHRVQAISLIHHKLYLSPGFTTVNMAVYLPEMVSYLRDNFVSKEDILFQLDLEPIELDVAQAVPVGLIVNEAITNAIKYAFAPSRQGLSPQGPAPQGLIQVSMKELSPDQCLLSIIDNGIGLSNSFDINKNSSLGMSLIRGLTKNLGGRLHISSNPGARIELVFNHHPETSGAQNM